MFSEALDITQWTDNVCLLCYFIVDEDPCKSGRSKCGEHSSCVSEGDSFRCVCNPGWVI